MTTSWSIPPPDCQATVTISIDCPGCGQPATWVGMQNPAGGTNYLPTRCACFSPFVVAA